MRQRIALAVFALATACGPTQPGDSAYSSLHGESGINSGKSFEDIVADFKALAAKHSQLAEIFEYGQSTQGKKLTVMKIQDKSVTPAGKRPAVLISEGIHGNEYLNITDRLPREFLEGAADNSGFKKFLAKGGIIYVVPILNPDGYNARRRENNRGQDLNRDFTIRAAGNQGFTQPETRSISEYMAKEAQANSFTLEASMEYHCCIGGLIHPWAYTRNPLPADALKRHKDVGQMVQTLFGYRSGTVREIVGYDAVGGSDDYYYETYGRRAFSFEGAQGTEHRNLAKHVDLWYRIFDMAGAEYPDPANPNPNPNPNPQPNPPPAAGDTLYLAVGAESAAGQVTLFAAGPGTNEGISLCLGPKDQCATAQTTAKVVRTTFVKTVGSQRIYRADEALPLPANGQITLLPLKAGALDTQAATTTVQVTKK